jgi:outer membrane lipoprotein carrier protein
VRAITKLIYSVLFLIPSLASANEGINQFKNFLSQVQSAEGDFVQQQVRPARAGEDKPKVLRKSQGHFIFQRPGKFVWETLKPFEQKDQLVKVSNLRLQRFCLVEAQLKITLT